MKNHEWITENKSEGRRERSFKLTKQGTERWRDIYTGTDQPTNNETSSEELEKPSRRRERKNRDDEENKTKSENILAQERQREEESQEGVEVWYEFTYFKAELEGAQKNRLTDNYKQCKVSAR